MYVYEVLDDVMIRSREGKCHGENGREQKGKIWMQSGIRWNETRGGSGVERWDKTMFWNTVLARCTGTR